MSDDLSCDIHINN